MTKRFDYLMLSLEVGVARKYRRLTPAERWAAVAGVWCLAAKSPVSGALLIAHGIEVTEDDVAEQAGVPLAAARGALAKLKSLGELVWDDVNGAFMIEDWNRHQPAPKRAKPSDSPEALRERKRRSRAAKTESHADVTPLVTPPVTRLSSREVEVEGELEGELPPLPPVGGNLPSLPSRPGGNRGRDAEAFERQVADYAASRFPDLEPTVARGLVTSAIGWVKQPATEQAVDAYVRQHAGGDELGQEQRDTIAAAGARMVELNRSAAA